MTPLWIKKEKKKKEKDKDSGTWKFNFERTRQVGAAVQSMEIRIRESFNAYSFMGKKRKRRM